jgi:hypothetical protein
LYGVDRDARSGEWYLKVASVGICTKEMVDCVGLIIASVGIRRVVRDAGIFVIPTNRSNRIMDRAVSIVDIVRRVGKCNTGYDKKQVVDGPHLQM